MRNEFKIASYFFWLNIYDRKNLISFKESERVSGVILFRNRSISYSSQPFSPDSTCPNENFGLYTEKENVDYAHCKKQSWNPQNGASGLIFQSFPFPIFLMEDEDTVQRMKNCYESFNKPISNGVQRSWPLCSVELKIQMNAAVSTPKCMARNRIHTMSTVSFCDPLTSRNVFSSLFPKTNSSLIKDASTIIISAHLDSFSLFDDISPGADSVVSGLVTLLSIAQTLASVREEIAQQSTKDEFGDIIFAIFDGESWDYIGSSATVYDMELGRFPRVSQSMRRNFIEPSKIKLSHISHFIELGSLARHDIKSDDLWIHSDPVSRKDSDIDNNVSKMVQILKDAAASSGSNINVREANKNQGLPPASVQSFLKKYPKISSIFISNHEKEFENIHYNSFLDEVRRNDSLEEYESKFIDRIVKVSQIVSDTVVQLFADKKEKLQTKVDRDWVVKLLECYLFNRTCQVFQQVSGIRMNPSQRSLIDPYPTYVSVNNSRIRQQLVTATLKTLFLLTGVQVNEVKDVEDCWSQREKDTVSDYNWMLLGDMNTSACFKSATYDTYAISPAFDPDNEDWSSTEYSTWTESVWETSRARMFLKPSPTREWLTLAIGIVILVLSFVIVHLMERNSDLLFNSKNSLLNPAPATPGNGNLIRADSSARLAVT